MILSRLFKATLAVLAFFWVTQNIRPIPPGSQAIVSRFGAVVRVQQDGVLVAWPPPLEYVVVMPANDRHFLQNGSPGMEEAATVLTADGNVAVVNGRIQWRMAGASPLAEADLRAVFDACAVNVGARHPLVDLLPPHDAAGRELASLLDGKLAELQKSGAGPDMKITHAEIAFDVPPKARSAADAQARAAEASLAATRVAAARQLQQTDRDRDRIFANAHAEAAERISIARSSTATLTALESRMNQATRPALLSDLYRERIAAILHQAGGITTVDPKSVSKVVIPDAP